MPGVADLLALLAAHLGLVAVISGRPASFLQSVLASPSGVRLIGLYGLEEVGSDGSRILAPGAAPWEAVITELVALARATAPDGDGRRAQGTHHDLALAQRSRGSRLGGSEVVVQQSKARGLAVHSGRHELELRPPLAVDKGTVVRRLVAGFDAVAAFGDDIGDLPAFDVLAELSTTGVAVARVAALDAESPAGFAYRADPLSGPAGVWRCPSGWLRPGNRPGTDRRLGISERPRRAGPASSRRRSGTSREI